jgi:NADH-quinone oxidoreductase subunit H
MDFLRDPIKFIGDWLTDLLVALNLSSGFITTIKFLIAGLVIAVFSLVLLIFLIWAERKISGRFQDRIGPNRAGPWGILQTFPDLIKLIIKEMIVPANADKAIFNFAPILAFAAVIMIWAVVPFSSTWIGVDLNVGALYITAVGSFGVLAILMGGWASNNKYSLFGAFRAVAQLVSYEVPLLMSMLVPVLLARTMSTNGIVAAQDVWFVVLAPLPLLIFFLSSVAELGRSPFDLLEADSEIVAGYITEYSGMRFAMFFGGEYMHTFVVGVVVSIMFLGGWRGPGAEEYKLLGFLYLMIKAFIFYFVALWFRNSLPRLRIDHLLDFNWKFLTPLVLVLVMVVAVVEKLVEGAGTPVRIVSLLTANILVGFATFLFLRSSSNRRKKQLKTFPPRPAAVPPSKAMPNSSESEEVTV